MALLFGVLLGTVSESSLAFAATLLLLTGLMGLSAWLARAREETAPPRGLQAGKEMLSVLKAPMGLPPLP